MSAIDRMRENGKLSAGLQGPIANLSPSYRKRNPNSSKAKDRVCRRRIMFEQAMANAITPNVLTRIWNKAIDIATNDPDPDIALRAMNFISNRLMGKAGEHIQIDSNTTLTLEERKTIVFKALGIDNTDETLQFGTRKVKSRVIESDQEGTLALPASIPDGHQPVPDSGESASDRLDVHQRPEVSDETGILGTTDESPVLKQG